MISLGEYLDKRLAMQTSIKLLERVYHTRPLRKRKRIIKKHIKFYFEVVVPLHQWAEVHFPIINPEWEISYQGLTTHDSRQWTRQLIVRDFSKGRFIRNGAGPVRVGLPPASHIPPEEIIKIQELWHHDV